MYRNGCGGAVADNIIEMTVYIEVGIGVQVFQNGFEVLAVSSFFGASFIVFRVIGIDSVNNVGGTDDKIKRMSGHCFAVDFRDVGLQTDFDSETNGKTVTAGVLKTADFFYIGIKIQKKQIGIIRVIIIKMIGKTDAIQVLPYSGLDHVRHQCVTVSAVMRVHMCIPKHKSLLFSVWLILEKVFS